MATEPINLPIRTPGASRARGAVAGLGRSVAGLAAGYIGLQAAVRAFTSTATLIRDFEFQMSQVRAISGANEEQFQRLNSIARELGGTTVFTARQAAEGLTELARAGLNAEQAIATIPTVLTLSASWFN